MFNWLLIGRFKYKGFVVITQLRVTVTLLYLTQKHITYLIEIKGKNSSNIFFITENENLYFKVWSPFQPFAQKIMLYRCLKVTLYWFLFLRQISNALWGTQILYSLNLSFNENPSLRNYCIYWNLLLLK